MLTEDQLRRIMPNLPAAKAAGLLPHLNRAMAEYGINTAQRAAAFVAQLAHESGEFRWMEEIWGPTPAQRRYEPLTDLSRKLGNIQPGDGKRFKGRGPIQLTGRANYQRFGQLLGLDLVSAPEQAATPEVGFRTAALYWANRGLNELADAQNFREITRRINGGYNGLPDRQSYFERAKAIFATGFGVVTRGAAAGARAVLPPVSKVPAEPLTRGIEVIQKLSTPSKRAGKKRSAKAAVKRKASTRKVATKKGGRGKPRPTKTSRRKAPAAAKRTTKTAGKRTAPASKTAARKTVKRRVAVKSAKRAVATTKLRRR